MDNGTVQMLAVLPIFQRSLLSDIKRHSKRAVTRDLWTYIISTGMGHWEATSP